MFYIQHLIYLLKKVIPLKTKEVFNHFITIRKTLFRISFTYSSNEFMIIKPFEMF